MRLLILSDLHIELWRDGGPAIDLARAQADAVILAGDIHTGANGAIWARDAFPAIPTFYVAGNHEAYGGKLEEVESEIQETCLTSGNMHYLNAAEQIIGGVRFLGATLWTDFHLFSDQPADRQLAMLEAERIMNDYHRIRFAKQGYRKLRARDTAQLHARQRAWLATRLAEPFAGKTVVITHMAPSMMSVAPRYAQDVVSAAYASRLDGLAAQADLWVHGHMHDSFDYRIGKCRVVCNPRGYRMRSGVPENSAFDPEFVAELG